jgi:formimidoylglutamase
MAEEDGLAFTKFEWSITPKDPNDRLLGTLVSHSVKLEECDAVLLGLPFDGAQLGRLGAAEGPKALRAAARMLKIHRFGGAPARYGPHATAVGIAGVRVGSSNEAVPTGATTSVPVPATDAETVVLPTGDGALRASIKPSGTVSFVPLPGMTAMQPAVVANDELRTRIVDLGDAVLPVSDVPRAHAEAEKAARCAKLLARMCRNDNARVISIGGDHSLTFPCARSYLEEFKEHLAVINLDAHLDLRAVRAGEPHNSGTSFSRLIDHGLSTYVVIGARDFQSSPTYVRKMESINGRIITARQCFSKGIEAVARDVLENLPRKTQAIYLSVDLDVADASVAPGVSSPTPGGLLSHHLLDLVNILSNDKRIISCDIMELAPRLEEPNNDRTARLGAACLAHMLANFQT